MSFCRVENCVLYDKKCSAKDAHSCGRLKKLVFYDFIGAIPLKSDEINIGTKKREVRKWTPGVAAAQS